MKLASYADVLRTRDKPKNVCVAGYYEIRCNKKFNRGQITEEEKNLTHNRSDDLYYEKILIFILTIINWKGKQSKVMVSGEVKEEEVPIFLMMQKKCYKS